MRYSNRRLRLSHSMDRRCTELVARIPVTIRWQWSFHPRWSRGNPKASALNSWPSGPRTTNHKVPGTLQSKFQIPCGSNRLDSGVSMGHRCAGLDRQIGGPSDSAEIQFRLLYFEEAAAQMALIATSSPSPSGTATLGLLAKYQRRLSKGDRTVRLPGICK